MFSARSIFEEIRSHDDAYRLFLSIAAKGEYQGGWENERIAALTRDRELAAKIARHGEDEMKHGKLFTALLRKRHLEPAPVPPEADYCMLLEQQGIGLPHARLHRDEPLRVEEILAYLAHSRVTEQRAAEEIALQEKIFGADPEIGRAVRMIADDEENHLAYCHEELLRLAEEGHAETIRAMLRRYALAEIRTYRDVSLAVMGHVGRLLAWPRWKSGVLAAAIRGVYAFERLVGWRRMVRLRLPARRNAMAPRHEPSAGTV
jgi:hypothetical protein